MHAGELTAGRRATDRLAARLPALQRRDGDGEGVSIPRRTGMRREPIVGATYVAAGIGEAALGQGFK